MNYVKNYLTNCAVELINMYIGVLYYFIE